MKPLRPATAGVVRIRIVVLDQMRLFHVFVEKHQPAGASSDLFFFPVFP